MRKYYLLSILLCCLLSINCSNDKSTENTAKTELDDKVDSLLALDVPDEGNNSVAAKVLPPAPSPPPPSNEGQKIKDEYSAKSVFLGLGCCEDKDKRQESCCCEAILKEYAKLYEQHAESEPEKLVDIATTDPLLGDCKKMLPKAFDAIENPVPPQDSTDNFDDLW